MDPILALAILTFLIFLALCVLGLVYLAIIRPGLLAQERAAAPPAPRPATPDPVTRGIGGGGDSLPLENADIADLKETLDSLLASVVSGNTRNSQQLDAQLEKIRQIHERLNVQDAHLTQLGQRMDSLREDIQQQEGLMKNATNILQELGQTGALAILAGRMADMGEVVDSLAGQLTDQEDLVREIHAQAAPAYASETLYSMLAEQAQMLDRLAVRLQAVDSQLPEGGPGLDDEATQLHATLTQLQTQITQQETLLHDLAAGEMSDKLDDILSKLNKVDSSVSVVKSRKPPAHADRMTDIKGVGRVFASMLAERGIDTFEELTAFSPDELRNLFTVPRWRGIDAESWIEQAQNLALAKAKTEPNS